MFMLVCLCSQVTDYLSLSIPDITLYKSTRRACLIMRIFFDSVEKDSNLCQKNIGGLAKLCFLRNCAK